QASAADGRFNMYQNGRVMTADDFDAWLTARGLRLENGRQVPIHPAPAATAAASPAPAPVVAPQATAPAPAPTQVVASP
ncbi:hypothetical protein, partial [Bacillus sp. SIMBA_005]